MKPFIDVYLSHSFHWTSLNIILFRGRVEIFIHLREESLDQFIARHGSPEEREWFAMSIDEQLAQLRQDDPQP